MLKITLVYEKKKYVKIQEINQIVHINNLLEEYSKLINIQKKDLSFIYKGKDISFDNKKIQTQIKKNNNNKNIIISVFSLKKNKNYKIDSNNIICPDCRNLAFLNIVGDKIIINKCVGQHNNTFLSINDFIESQIIDERKIKCNICKNSKFLYNNFYYCSCGKFICPLCKEHHDNKNHNLIEYNNKYSICPKHNNEYIYYCSICNINLCQICEETHDHKLIFHKSEMPSEKRKNQIKDDLLKNSSIILEYKKQINKLNKLFNIQINDLNNNLEQYMKLFNKMIYTLGNLNNYESIKNILNFKTTELYKEIINFLTNENIKNKFNYLIDKFDVKRNDISLIYKISKEKEKVKIFGEEFVKNNKRNCFLLIDNALYDLMEYFYLNDNVKKKNLKVKLIEENKMDNISYMFCGCEELLSLSDISKWNTSNINNMSHLFDNCKSLPSLPDISKWDTSNINNMSHLFDNCNSLSSLPDISKWNTNKVTDISSIFNNCKLLSSLPDISKWNTINVTDISHVFSGCVALPSIPNISRWSTNNVKDMSNLFYYCNSLISLPDISKWNTKNVINMSHIFHYCNSLVSLPDISNWNTENVINMNHMFYGCKSLSSLPDISKWNISKVKYLNHMFFDCHSLSSLPDISNWNTQEVIDMSYFFSHCDKLTRLPNISKWNTNNVTDISYMFYNCSSLTIIPDITILNTKKDINKSNIFK